jgi:hypothetical protein
MTEHRLYNREQKRKNHKSTMTSARKGECLHLTCKTKLNESILHLIGSLFFCIATNEKREVTRKCSHLKTEVSPDTVSTRGINKLNEQHHAVAPY